MPRSIVDFIFNRNLKPESPGFFRDVPGRFSLVERDAMPVNIVNRDGYQLSQSSYTLIAANTEYPVRGIVTLASVVIKARGGTIQFSIYEGQSNAVFTLLNDGQALEISTVPFGQINTPFSIYARSTTPGCVVEFIGLRLI